MIILIPSSLTRRNVTVDDKDCTWESIDGLRGCFEYIKIVKPPEIRKRKKKRRRRGEASVRSEGEEGEEGEEGVEGGERDGEGASDQEENRAAAKRECSERDARDVISRQMRAKVVVHSMTDASAVAAALCDGNVGEKGGEQEGETEGEGEREAEMESKTNKRDRKKRKKKDRDKENRKICQKDNGNKIKILSKEIIEASCVNPKKVKGTSTSPRLQREHPHWNSSRLGEALAAAAAAGEDSTPKRRKR